MYEKASACVGRRYGKLVVTSVFRENKKTMADAVCDCGGTIVRELASLKSGLVKSCRCLLKEARGRPSDHGHCEGYKSTPTYSVWSGMKTRCTNPNSDDYPRYGGRGITVSSRWMVFDNFIADMGEKPTGKSLDRINNDLGYSPENCRWATPKEQANNRRPATLRASSDL